MEELCATRNAPPATVRLTELSKLNPDLAKRVAKQTGAELKDEQSSAAAAAQATSPPAITADKAAEICVRHGIMDRAEADRIRVKMRDGANQPSEQDDWPTGDAALGFLSAADRVHAFDVETGMLPNRHDLLIVDIAQKSAGRFHPEAVLETYKADAPDAETGQYQVQFIHGDRLYRFQPNDLGDW